MNIRSWYGHWLLSSAKRHELKSFRLKERAEILFQRIKNGVQKNGK